jgi:hypothetical protein
MADGDAFAENPGQQAENESYVGELEEAAGLGVEAAIPGIHKGGSYIEFSR